MIEKFLSVCQFLELVTEKSEKVYLGEIKALLSFDLLHARRIYRRGKESLLNP